VTYLFQPSAGGETLQRGSLTHEDGEEFFANLFSNMPLGQALALRLEDGASMPILLTTNAGGIRTLSPKETQQRADRP
jgi:hypothetical protein